MIFLRSRQMLHVLLGYRTVPVRGGYCLFENPTVSYDEPQGFLEIIGHPVMTDEGFEDILPRVVIIFGVHDEYLNNRCS
jgi:hypothetical protein